MGGYQKFYKIGREVIKGKGAVGRMINSWNRKKNYGKLLKILIYWNIYEKYHYFLQWVC